MCNDSLYAPCPKCGKSVFKNSKKCPKCGALIKKKNGLRGLVVFLGFVLLFWVLRHIFISDGLHAGGDGSAISEQKMKKDVVVLDDDAALKLIKLDYEWFKNDFGSVMEVNFMIKNSNPFAVKDLKIRCESAAPSGTIIDSNESVIYDTFPSGQSKKILKFNMGFVNSQVEKTSCFVVSYKRI